MLDCQGRQMGIGNQISSRLPLKQHFLKNFPMIPGWVNHAGTGLIKPALHTLDSVVQSKGIFKNPAVGPNPDERGENHPAETYRFSAGETGIPPLTRLSVMGT